MASLHSGIVLADIRAVLPRLYVALLPPATFPLHKERNLLLLAVVEGGDQPPDG